VTILAALGQIELHLSVRALDRGAADVVLDRACEQVRSVLGDDVYSIDGRSLEAVLGDLLVARQFRIAIAESCTGGLITSRLIDVAGSSRYVDRAYVVYSNASKTALLGVPQALLAEHGAVSEPVAVAMARGAREAAAVDLAIGVTGIAGPDGGTPEKPVGTVAVAVVGEGVSRVRTFRFMGERTHVKFQAAQAGLDMARRLLIAQPGVGRPS
jgi:nicotinamide-nucleotide amidase